MFLVNAIDCYATVDTNFYGLVLWNIPSQIIAHLRNSSSRWLRQMFQLCLHRPGISLCSCSTFAPKDEILLHLKAYLHVLVSCYFCIGFPKFSCSFCIFSRTSVYYCARMNTALHCHVHIMCQQIFPDPSRRTDLFRPWCGVKVYWRHRQPAYESTYPTFHTFWQLKMTAPAKLIVGRGGAALIAKTVMCATVNWQSHRIVFPCHLHTT